jgi:predicted ATP-grasp superfamily ATP-dependent carboligase
MEELRLSSQPTLRRPVLITAFRGWNDGGQGASLAAGFLARTWQAARFADIDPEQFFDFQATRPHVSLVDGVTRQIDWPDNAFYHAPIPGTDRDALLLLGIEPNVRWRTFSGIVTELAQDLGVELVVTLGSLLADVPRLGLQPSRYEGPTGIVGVLHDSCKNAGLPSASLWAAVPHYVSLAPSPRAALSLCRRLGEMLETEIDTDELEEASESYSQQVSEAVAADPETAAYVEELEQRTEEIEEEENLPSGDALAAELTRYLREREKDNGGPEGPAS